LEDQVDPVAARVEAKKRTLTGLRRTVKGIAWVSGVVVLGATIILPSLPERWWLQLAIFFAVATLPHWPLEAIARRIELIGRDFLPGDHVVGFENPGAMLGMVERPLFLGSLVAGYPELIGIWFVYKGIAGYRVSGSDDRARRKFQLFLLNSAVSLSGVAIAWMLWNLLGLPRL
jgi:hypothetical protein